MACSWFRSIISGLGNNEMKSDTRTSWPWGISVSPSASTTFPSRCMTWPNPEQIARSFPVPAEFLLPAGPPLVIENKIAPVELIAPVTVYVAHCRHVGRAMAVLASPTRVGPENQETVIERHVSITEIDHHVAQMFQPAKVGNEGSLMDPVSPTPPGRRDRSASFFFGCSISGTARSLITAPVPPSRT